MGFFSKIVDWFKGPAEDEEVIEIAARKAAEKAAAMAAREQALVAETAPEESPVEKPVEKKVKKSAAKPAAKTAAKPVAKAAEKKAAKPVTKPEEKKAAKPVAKPAEKKAAKPVAKPAEKKAAKPVAPAREVKASDKFPGVTTYRELSILEKNSCAGADNASRNVATLTKELKETVLQIARLRNPVDADEATREKLSKERAVLRKQRDEKERTLTLARNAGVGLEKTADNCQFLIKELTGQVVNHRKAPRFNEVSVDISAEEVKQMRKILK